MPSCYQNQIPPSILPVSLSDDICLQSPEEPARTQQPQVVHYHSQITAHVSQLGLRIPPLHSHCPHCGPSRAPPIQTLLVRGVNAHNKLIVQHKIVISRHLQCPGLSPQGSSPSSSLRLSPSRTPRSLPPTTLTVHTTISEYVMA